MAQRDTGRRGQPARPGDLCPWDPTLQQGSETPSTPGTASGQNADSPRPTSSWRTAPPKVEAFQQKTWKTSPGKRRISTAMSDFASPGVKPGSEEKASTESHQAPEGDFLSPRVALEMHWVGQASKGLTPWPPVCIWPPVSSRGGCEGRTPPAGLWDTVTPTRHYRISGLAIPRSPEFGGYLERKPVSPNGKCVCTSEVKSDV